MVHIKINNIPVEVEEGTTILDAAKKLNITIPTLCYLKDYMGGIENHESSCRVCVVEVKGRRNLAASCSTVCTENMEVVTNSARVIRSRRAIIELLLSNHSQECTMCEKNFHCNLQKIATDMNIRSNPFQGEISQPNVYVQSEAIKRNASKCILCGNCIKVCEQVQSVGILGYSKRGFKTVVGPAFGEPLDNTICVACGQCVEVCPTGALSQENEVSEVWSAIHDPEKFVVVQVAPAVRVALGEEFGYATGTSVTGKMVGALKCLGFDKVFDTNFAADLTIMEESNELVERLVKNENLPLITSCCPGWVKFVEEMYPELLNLPSSCKSPHEMFGAIVKSYYAQKMNLDPKNIVVVSVMPCTAKKKEALRPELANEYANVDYVVTTREICSMIREAGIDFDSVENSLYDSPLGESTGSADIFGTSGGVMEAALRNAVYTLEGKCPTVDFTTLRGIEGIKEATVTVQGKPLNIAVVSGLANARKVLDEIKAGTSKYQAVEVMACPGGCINGGGQPFNFKKGSKEVVGLRSEALYSIDRSKKDRISCQNKDIQTLYKEFLGKPGSEAAHTLLHTTYHKRTY
jgi:NADH-quinone oxidoreductase subunit G